MVSIIVTHKQCLRYLEECLNSIAEQEFQDYETVLVVDDLQDEPEEFQKVIDKYKERIHLRLFYLEGKTGVSAARNFGMDKAQENISIFWIMMIIFLRMVLKNYWMSWKMIRRWRMAVCREPIREQ